MKVLGGCIFLYDSINDVCGPQYEPHTLLIQ